MMVPTKVFPQRMPTHSTCWTSTGPKRNRNSCSSTVPVEKRPTQSMTAITNVARYDAPTITLTLTPTTIYRDIKTESVPT